MVVERLFNNDIHIQIQASLRIVTRLCIYIYKVTFNRQYYREYQVPVTFPLTTINIAFLFNILQQVVC